MGQCWDPFCLDNEQFTGGLGMMGMVFYTDPHILEYELIRNVEACRLLPSTRPSAPLERLPLHIKRRICRILASVDIESLVCLILVVPHMAAEGQAILNSVLSWAGKRIICLGYSATDLPKNLLTKAEEKRWLGGNGTYILNIKMFREYLEMASFSTYPRAYACYTELPIAIRKHRRYFSFGAIVNPGRMYPENAALRNLTLKQYYRGCGDPNVYCKGDEDDDSVQFSFGQVVLLQTCWSSELSMAFSANLTNDDAHGEWAGHRLDIASAKTVDANWTDVTEVARQRLVRLRDRPSGWRD